MTVLGVHDGHIPVQRWLNDHQLVQYGFAASERNRWSRDFRCRCRFCDSETMRKVFEYVAHSTVTDREVCGCSLCNLDLKMKNRESDGYEDVHFHYCPVTQEGWTEKDARGHRYEHQPWVPVPK